MDAKKLIHLYTERIITDALCHIQAPIKDYKLSKSAKVRVREDIEEFLEKAYDKEVDLALWPEEVLAEDFLNTRNMYKEGFLNRYPLSGRSDLYDIALEFGVIWYSLDRDKKVLSFR